MVLVIRFVIRSFVLVCGRGGRGGEEEEKEALKVSHMVGMLLLRQPSS